MSFIDLGTVVEKVAALFYLILGVSLILRASYWAEVFPGLAKSKDLLAVLSFTILLMGLTIVVTHNTWKSDASTIITLFGWITTVKYASLLILPDKLIPMMPKKKQTTANLLRFGGIIFVVCSLLVLKLHYF